MSAATLSAVTTSPISESHETARMSVAHWIAMPDNPRQRDTERHAKKAINWLASPSPAHLVVHAARLDDGTLVKLDGHARAYLWACGKIQIPVALRVQFYRVRDLAAAAELYTHFDNARAVESSADRAFGAMRQIGLEAKGSFIRRCRFGDALRLAQCYSHGMVHRDSELREYELVREWNKELELLDTLDPVPRQFPGPLITAFVMSVRRRGGKAEDFWLKYKTEEGNRAGKERDPVQALIELMLTNRNSRAKLAAYELCGKALSAVEAFVTGRSFTGGLRLTFPEEYLSMTRHR